MGDNPNYARNTSMDINEPQQSRQQYSASSDPSNNEKDYNSDTVRDVEDDRKDADQNTFNRVLKEYHVVFITISGVLGITTIFLVITAFSSANTALYIASRTLYDLGRNVSTPDGPFFSRDWTQWPSCCRKWPAKLVSLFGQVTPKTRVPSTAVLFSYFAFLWLPFLLFVSRGRSEPKILYALSAMGAECCVMVWACQCLAFINFYRLYVFFSAQGL